MSPEDIYYAIKIVAASIGIIAIVGGAGVAFGKWLFGRGNTEGKKETTVDATLARLNKIADKFEQKLEKDQVEAVEQARKEGARELWERTLEERVDEIDKTVNEFLKGRGSGTRIGGGR